MLINFYKINPGGNITAIINKAYFGKQKIEIAKLILQNDPSIEQVGFLTKPKDPKSMGRIEMMGGEFCGNATRCLGYLLWDKNKIQRNFLIESSGMEELIETKVLKDYSEISLSIRAFKEIRLGKFNCVELPGIVHVIVESDMNKEKAMDLLKQMRLLSRPAVGVISVSRNNQGLQIKPFVWVRDTKTFYEESACASGSLAVGYFYSNLYSRLSVMQPSGCKLLVTLRNRGSISVGGAILSIEKKQIEIST